MVQDQSQLSPEVTATTTLPAPGTPDVSDVTMDTADVSWDATHTNGNTRVEVRPSSESEWQTETTVSYDVEEVTITGLQNGDAHDTRVVATTAHTESPSPSTQFTTSLPSIQQGDFALGNGVEDEIQISLTAQPLNYGDYRFEYRETGATEWQTGTTIPHDEDAGVIQGLEDGEEYEVRGWTVTEHASTTPTGSRSIITKFPGAANLQLDPDASITPTSIPLVWIDQSDNELGHDVERRRRYDSGWGPWRTRFELDANTESHVDDTVLPGRDYEYRIRAYTDDTEAYSNTVAASTPDLDAPNESIPARGWYIELDHPSGTTLSPRVVDDPQRNPQVNGLPGLQIPVPRDDKWTAYTDQPVRVWADGRRQPIDELIRVEQSPEESVLVAEGATELRQTVQRDVVEERADDFIEDLLSEETSYESVVDEPTGTREENIPVQGVDTESDYSALLADAISDTEPVRLNSDGTIELLATLDANIPWGTWDWSGEVEEATSNNYLNSQALRLTTLSAVDEAWTSVGLEYDLPSDRVGVAVRFENETPSTEHLEFEIQVDDTTVTTIPSIFLEGNEGMTWFEVANPGTELGDLSAGNHEVRVVPVSPGADSESDNILLNGACVYDSRDYSGISSSAGTAAAEPVSHARDYQLEFADSTPTQSVVGGRVEVDISGTGGGMAVALSNDSGATWRTQSNTESFETDWTSAAASLRARVTLSSSDDEYVDGLLRQQGQVLDVVDVFADLQDIPVLVNEPYDASIEEIMTQVAKDTDSVWQARIMGGEYVVEWTQPGQRPLELAMELIDYSYSEDVSRMVEHARVFGAAREYSESITIEHDTEVDLTHSPVVSASETLEDPDSGEVYEYGADYVARNNAGTIEALSTGDLSDGQSVEVSYEYKLQGSYTKQGVSDPRSRRFDVNIPTERGCGQAALYLVEQLGEPVVEAEIVVPKQALGWDAINALTVPGLPGSRHQVKSIEETPEEIRAVLESRESVGEVVGDLRREVTGNTRRT